METIKTREAGRSLKKFSENKAYTTNVPGSELTHEDAEFAPGMDSMAGGAIAQKNALARATEGSFIENTQQRAKPSDVNKVIDMSADTAHLVETLMWFYATAPIELAQAVSLANSLAQADRIVVSTKRIAELEKAKESFRDFDQARKMLEGGFRASESQLLTQVLNLAPRAGTYVRYGSTDLSKAAIAYRMQKNIRGLRDVAVFEYEANGALRMLAAVSDGKGLHAERMAWRQLQAMGIPASRVKRIYSDFEPCTKPMISNCEKFIADTFPNAEVTYSFEYGFSATSRAKGVEGLRGALEGLPK